LEVLVYNYKNNNEEYVKLIKSIENKISAIISVIKAMRNNPEEYSAFVYHNNNYNQSPLSSLSSTTRSKGNNNKLSYSSRQVMTLPPPPYDEYIIEHYKDIILEETEKFYKILVDQLVCEVVNENVC
jgi:hypothetical protein